MGEFSIMEWEVFYQGLECPQPSCLPPISALLQEPILFSLLAEHWLSLLLSPMGEAGYRLQLSDGTGPATRKEPVCLSQSQF